MKALFFDIDGVVTSEASLRYFHGLGFKQFNRPYPWDPIATSNFRLLLSAMPEVGVVVTSSKRTVHPYLEGLRTLFQDESGIDPARIIGATPIIRGVYRGMEIHCYLTAHPEITEFVILDDDDDMGQYRDSLVHTDGRVGLTLPLVDDVLRRLGYPGLQQAA